jgi:hypothetical protein
MSKDLTEWPIQMITTVLCLERQTKAGNPVACEALSKIHYGVHTLCKPIPMLSPFKLINFRSTSLSCRSTVLHQRKPHDTVCPIKFLFMYKSCLLLSNSNHPRFKQGQSLFGTFLSVTFFNQSRDLVILGADLL